MITTHLKFKRKYRSSRSFFTIVILMSVLLNCACDSFTASNTPIVGTQQIISPPRVWAFQAGETLVQS